MIKSSLPFTIALLPLMTIAQEFGGNPSSIQWKQMNTDKVRVIFPRGLDSQANRVANVVSLLGNTTAVSIGGKQRKWNILLQNQTTIPNAYVRMAPVMSELYLTAAQDNFSTGSLRWDDNLVIHENRHIQQFSNFNKGIAPLFSFFLGQEGQLFANGIFIPNYFFEGDATWQETLVSKQGRGRMPSFYNGFKSLWEENKRYSWMKIRNGSFKDFIPDHYPLGYMMVAYGNATYGDNFWNKITHEALQLKGFKKGIKRYSGKHFISFYKDAMNYFKNQSIIADKNNTPLTYLTATKKNNVVDYRFPFFIGNDSMIVSKQSYKEPSAFYILANGSEKKIRVKDLTLDESYSYRNGNIVYAAYQSDPRRGNRDYSLIKRLNIYTGQQKQLSFKSKLFSPDINEAGTEILAVCTFPGGINNLMRLDANDGKLIYSLPNPANYFFTQTRYINSGTAVSAVRHPDGKMALVKVNLANGATEALTPFTYNVMGYPFIKGDTIYFTLMNNHADKVFALIMENKKIYRVTQNTNGIYQPVVNERGEMLVSAFTAGGYRLAKINNSPANWQEVSETDFSFTPDLYTPAALQKSSATNLLNTIPEIKNKVTDYKKTFRLFNFHSWRPVAEDPEFGYSFFSNDVLSNFNNSLSYTYNRSDKSHTVGFTGSYAGWFPVLSMYAEHSFNRSVDTAIGKSVQFNSAKLQGTISLPLSFVGGRNSQFINMGAGYNIEPFFYSGIGKNVLKNKTIHYANMFFSVTNQSRLARQNIFPHWAQTLSISYRDAFTFRNSHKLVANSSFYFPGFFTNQSLVINASWQQRDSLPDLFSKTFAYSRGYEALSTRQMYKLGVNYHLPLLYPDWGFANLLFIQRVRSNVFYDYTNARARVNGILTDIKNRSTGGELYFDTKVWNALPVTLGLRFSHLLDTDRFNPAVKNRWEIIIPIGLIPD